MVMLVCWAVTPCGPVCGYHHFGGTFFLHLKPSRWRYSSRHQHRYIENPFQSKISVNIPPQTSVKGGVTCQFDVGINIPKA
jgi:hypothetical protein